MQVMVTPPFSPPSTPPGRARPKYHKKGKGATIIPIPSPTYICQCPYLPPTVGKHGGEPKQANLDGRSAHQDPFLQGGDGKKLNATTLLCAAVRRYHSAFLDLEKNPLNRQLPSDPFALIPKAVCGQTLLWLKDFLSGPGVSCLSGGDVSTTTEKKGKPPGQHSEPLPV
ncbi:hypothetical protein GWK47_001792 [Chionoecetes opilio]|uniref:Uncharacterized protein n=1 Tax=Chionoecetes opilio TaxID=41210 RepID=A0A8J4XS89_CHIOP|nr:hypothetical protein GWK47_001792 [Chionoecetes opilio]